MDRFKDRENLYEKSKACSPEDLKNIRQQADLHARSHPGPCSMGNEFDRLLRIQIRDDQRAIDDVIHQRRDFPYLIKSRQLEELDRECRDIYDHGGCALTVTYKEQLRTDNQEFQLRDITRELLLMFTQRFVLYPDVDMGGNYHYHGVCYITHRKKAQMKRVFTKNVGFVKFSCIEDMDIWHKYMRKGYGFKSREHPLPLTSPIMHDDEIEELACVYSHKFQDELTSSDA